jgi:transcriptional regulator with XRE-family HTH domain
MTPSQPPSAKARRAPLGAELRRLRRRSGVSGEAIARALTSSQSAVSRIETGDGPISMPGVLAWASAVGATADETAELRRLLERALTEVTPLPQKVDADGFAGIQASLGRGLEATSGAITSFQPFFVPGLLQTAAYARQVLATFRPAETLDADVAARLERQPILYDAMRRFEFILTESALRWRAGPVDVLPPQFGHITSVATLDTVTIRVIPTGVAWQTAPICAFTLYEERGEEAPVATIETLGHRVESEDVKPYKDELELLRRSALSGDEAIAFIRDMAR